ncbi:hypothetical protein VSDG_09094 [Cytospora chrysosperma]|uniref:Tse2 ADP-ribosyltransferase toxin domain-containing protein n=1 Tax=Cytospora chrysosperma TaxID=252740 RepID=A0A423VEI3_CYTCH|nr:hypothetical protein VSDG_09094 [Valsa sordida]
MSNRTTVLNMARPLFQGLTRRQSHLPRLHSRASAQPRRFHATATNFTSTSPPPFAALEGLPARRIYTESFPCTLHYYSSRGPKLALFDHKKLPPHDLGTGRYIHHDHVHVGDAGLVDPRDSSVRWNGLHMYPNTINSVELMGYFSDEAEECRMQGQDVPTPWMFTIPKGTPLPGHLFLVYEDLEQFHLLAREAKPVSVLSEELNHFFNSHGSKMPKGDWNIKYFLEGCKTYSEHEYMAR